MKKIIFILAILLIGTVVICCQSPAKKEKEAQEDLQEAHQDSIQNEKREIATAEEWQNFTKEINPKIDVNETQITELKRKIKGKEKFPDSLYSKDIQELEKRNKDLKMRITAYKNDNDWESFKKELNQEVNEIDQTLKNMKTTTNK